ncbi:hypothetical protein BC567DRAFT_6117 [Phyllosticta citribraziliensis]
MAEVEADRRSAVGFCMPAKYDGRLMSVEQRSRRSEVCDREGDTEGARAAWSLRHPVWRCNDAIFVPSLLGRYLPTSSCKYYCTAIVVSCAVTLDTILTRLRVRLCDRSPRSRILFSDRNDATPDIPPESRAWNRSRQQSSTIHELQVPLIASGKRSDPLQVSGHVRRGTRTQMTYTERVSR